MERTKDRIWPVTAPDASTTASTEQESDEEVSVPGDGVQLTEEGSEKETVKPCPDAPPAWFGPTPRSPARTGCAEHKGKGRVVYDVASGDDICSSEDDGVVSDHGVLYPGE